MFLKNISMKKYSVRFWKFHQWFIGFVLFVNNTHLNYTHLSFPSLSFCFPFFFSFILPEIAEV